MLFRRRIDVSISLEKYLENFQLKQFLGKVGVSNPEVFAKEVEHFTIKEAEKKRQNSY
jgi:hypothetical protein